MLKGAFAVVDLETTGCDPRRDRICEIAILRAEDGVVRERWSQLIDPCRELPAGIQALTGINEDMLRGQPRFAEVATEVRQRLEGATFVAHNARFDHAFLCHALARCDLELDEPVLCTLRVSRRLFPAERSHGLDALIARHGLYCAARHRALGDAEATWDFLQRATTGIEQQEFARLVADRRAPARRARSLPHEHARV